MLYSIHSEVHVSRDRPSRTCRFHCSTDRCSLRLETRGRRYSDIQVNQVLANTDFRLLMPLQSCPLRSLPPLQAHIPQRQGLFRTRYSCTLQSRSLPRPSHSMGRSILRRRQMQRRLVGTTRSVDFIRPVRTRHGLFRRRKFLGNASAWSYEGQSLRRRST